MPPPTSLFKFLDRVHLTKLTSTFRPLKEHVLNFWISLDPLVRRVVLLYDESKIVTQMYKINLSLLCAGMLQKNVGLDVDYKLLENCEFLDTNGGVLIVKDELGKL